MLSGHLGQPGHQVEAVGPALVSLIWTFLNRPFEVAKSGVRADFPRGRRLYGIAQRHGECSRFFPWKYDLHSSFSIRILGKRAV